MLTKGPAASNEPSSRSNRPDDHTSSYGGESRPRKSVIGALAALAVASLVLRYPTTSHETGIDSFFVHNLSLLIQVQGRAIWILNPLSLFGLYPMSYPTAAPMVVAQVSDIAGTGVEATILLLSLVYGVIGMFGAFAMAHEVAKNDAFALATAFFYGLAPRFLDFTLWTMSARGLFMALLPFFVWSLIRTYRTLRVREAVLAGSMFALLGATHHLTALLLVVAGAAVAAGSIVLCARLLRIRFPRTILSRPFRRSAPFIALAAFVGVSAAMIVAANVLPQYSQGELATGNAFAIELFNLGVSLLRSVGLSLVMALVGIVVIIRHSSEKYVGAFVVLAFLGLTPTLLLRVYTGFYILPFISLLAGFTVVRVTEVRSKRVRSLAVVGCFLAAGVLTGGVLRYEVDHSSIMSTATYSAATYIARLPKGQTVLASDGLLGVRVASYSACAYLPVGGASTLYESPEVLAYGFYSPAEIVRSVARVPWGNISIDSDSPFFDSTVQAEADWVGLMGSTFGAPSTLQTRYHPTLYLETGAANATFSAYGAVYSSRFASSVYEGAYEIYSDGVENAWYLQAPAS